MWYNQNETGRHIEEELNNSIKHSRGWMNRQNFPGGNVFYPLYITVFALDGFFEVCEDVGRRAGSRVLRLLRRSKYQKVEPDPKDIFRHSEKM
jgi:hypothetical protein